MIKACVLEGLNCQLDTAKNNLRRESQGCPDLIGLWACLWSGGGVMIHNWCKRAKPTMGSSIPKQVVLKCMGKLAEYKPLCKPASKQQPLWFLLTSWLWSESPGGEVTPCRTVSRTPLIRLKARLWPRSRRQIKPYPVLFLVFVIGTEWSQNTM